MAWWDTLTGLVQSAARPVAENIVGGALGAMRGAGGGPVDTSDYWAALAEQRKNRAAQADLEALSKLTGKSPVELRLLGPDAFGKVIPTSSGYMRVSPTGTEPLTTPGPIPESGGPPELVPLMPPPKGGSVAARFSTPAVRQRALIHAQEKTGLAAPPDDVIEAFIGQSEAEIRRETPNAQAGVQERFETRRTDREERDAENRVNALLTERQRIQGTPLEPSQRSSQLALNSARLDAAIRDLPPNKRVRYKRLLRTATAPAPTPGSLKTPGGTTFQILP